MWKSQQFIIKGLNYEVDENFPLQLSELLMSNIIHFLLRPNSVLWFLKDIHRYVYCIEQAVSQYA